MCHRSRLPTCFWLSSMHSQRSHPGISRGSDLVLRPCAPEPQSHPSWVPNIHVSNLMKYRFTWIFQKHFPYRNKQKFKSESFLSFFPASTSPKAWRVGRKRFFQWDTYVSPRLWILKRRILFHTLPNPLALPRLSPYLLFLLFLDDYFLSSSLFFFLLVFS